MTWIHQQRMCLFPHRAHTQSEPDLIYFFFIILGATESTLPKPTVISNELRIRKNILGWVLVEKNGLWMDAKSTNDRIYAISSTMTIKQQWQHRINIRFFGIVTNRDDGFYEKHRRNTGLGHHWHSMPVWWWVKSHLSQSTRHDHTAHVRCAWQCRIRIRPKCDIGVRKNAPRAVVDDVNPFC